MSEEQAIQILVDLAYKAELPKGITGAEASQYLNTIHQAKTVLESIKKGLKSDGDA